MGAQGQNKQMSKIMFKPIGNNKLSIYDILMQKDKDRRLKLSSFSEESTAGLSTSQRRLFKNADRNLQNRMIRENRLGAADTGLQYVGGKNSITKETINQKRKPMSFKKSVLGLGAG